MKILRLYLLLSSFFCVNLFAQNEIIESEILSLDKAWRFHLGDIPFPVIKGHNETYSSTKAGRATGAAAPSYDDKDWQEVNLPHDWAIEMPYDSNENLSQGYKKRGYGWYRRHFKLDASDRGKYLELQFDGISTHATIWINGTVVHRNWCGYTSSYIDITPLVKYEDQINTIAVRVDAVAQEGWWYEGAGIYRHTWLVKRSPIHIITDGIYANPIRKANQHWEIPVEITLRNTGKNDVSNVRVEASLYDKSGRKIAGKETDIDVKLFYNSVAQLTIEVTSPHLWSVDDPYLYTVETKIKQNGRQIDKQSTKCGFRTIRFEKDSGFYLNDKPMKLKGTCNHIDHAGVGVAVPASLWEFRVRKLKEMGSNAYRCAHNPTSKEFLEVCDSLGMLVMDENRNFNSSPEYIEQLRWLIRRDRNHPCVILWSVFNEEPMQGEEIGYEMVRRMSAEVKKLDTTRLVTAAMNGGLFSTINVSHAADIVGFNYQPQNYDNFRRRNPDMCMTSSEDVSCVMQRGQYVTDKNYNLLDSYDTQHPGWGTTHRKSWKAINERPYLAGCFVWTGFDYKGEPTPFSWPTVNSNFGIMDLCGFPKTAYYIYQAYWLQHPVLHIEPHWNWPTDSIGKNIKVMAISNVDKVRLILNDKFIDEESVDKYNFNTWDIPYKPGKLEAIGYKDGKEVVRTKVETTGEAVGLQLIPDRNYLSGDGRDAMPITVQAIDKKGRSVPTADHLIEFEIFGDGKLIGVGNGDPNSHEADKAKSRSLYHGLAQAIIQSNEAASGHITITAKSKDLKSTSITIPVIETALIPSVAEITPELILDKWLLSPISSDRPDPNRQLDDNDMNSWEPTQVGKLVSLGEGGYLIYRSQFIPYLSQQIKGGRIRIKGLTGKAEIWLNGELLGKKGQAETSDIVVRFTGTKGQFQLNILIEGGSNDKVGIEGIVSVLD